MAKRNKLRTELNKLQKARGNIYGDFKTHCENVAKKIPGFLPTHVGLFYIHSKQVRWENCPEVKNRDSLIDLISYIDLFNSAFGPDTTFPVEFTSKFKTELEELDNGEKGVQ